MTILDRAIWLEEIYSDDFYKNLGVCEIGEFTKDSREGWKVGSAEEFLDLEEPN